MALASDRALSLSDTKNSFGERLHLTHYYVGCATIMFFFLFSHLRNLPGSVPAMDEFERLADKVNARISFYWLFHYTTMIAFVVSTFIDVCGAVFTIHRAKRRMCLILVFINGVSCFTYIAIISGWAPVHADFNTRGLYAARYLQWSFTTPSLIFLIGQIARTQTPTLVQIIGFDWLMIVSGFLSSYCTSMLWIMVWGFVSFATFVPVMFGLWRMHDEAIDTAMHPDDEKTLALLQRITATIWSLFPIVWLLSSLALIDPLTAELLICMCDCSAKFVYSILLSSYNFLNLERTDVLLCLQDEDVFTDADITVRRIRQATDMVEGAITEGRSSGGQASAAFLKTMSHELRTPLNSVIAYNSLLLESTGLGVQEQDQTRSALCSAEGLLGMIDNLLDYSNMTSSGVLINDAPVDLLNTFEGVVAALQHVADKNDISIFLDMDAALPNCVLSDAHRIKQMVTILVHNAVKFNKAHGQVTITVNRVDKQLHVVVADTGIGIDNSRLGELFTEFSQLTPPQLTPLYGGCGLGLAIVRTVCENMNGECRCVSSSEAGSTFELWLPVVLNPAASDERVQRAETLSGLSVRVLHRDKTARALLAKWLGAWGVTVSVLDIGNNTIIELLEGNTSDVIFTTHDILFGVNDDVAKKCLAQCAARNQAMVLCGSQIEKHQAMDVLTQKFAFCENPLLESRVYTVLKVLRADKAAGSMGTGGSGNLADQMKDELAKLHLLVVDDSPVNLKVAGALLKRLGVSYQTAEDGVQAAEKANETKFDVILMDVQMPRMSGLESTIRIREQEAAKGNKHQAYIIGLSANALPEDRLAGKNAGMNEYVSKPIRLPIVEKLLHGQVSKCVYFSYHLFTAHSPLRSTPASGPPHSAPMARANCSSTGGLETKDCSVRGGLNSEPSSWMIPIPITQNMSLRNHKTSTCNLRRCLESRILGVTVRDLDHHFWRASKENQAFKINCSADVKQNVEGHQQILEESES